MTKREVKILRQLIVRGELRIWTNESLGMTAPITGMGVTKDGRGVLRKEEWEIGYVLDGFTKVTYKKDLTRKEEG